MSTAVRSNYPRVAAALGSLPHDLRGPIRQGLRRGLMLAAGVAQKEFLSGPRPDKLGVVTTRLRNSIAVKVEDAGDRIIGRIGSNVAYARYHEFGFHGIEQVKPFVRTVKEFNARGEEVGDSRRRIRERDTQRVVGYKDTCGEAAARKGHATTVQYVHGFTRHVNYGGRPFVRPALWQTENAIVKSVRDSIAAAIAKRTETGGLS